MAITVDDGNINTAPGSGYSGNDSGGTATDDQDVTLLDVNWTSNVDGSLGSGTPIENGETDLTVSSLSAADHTITVVVSDEEGATGEDSVDITVLSSAVP